MKNKKGITLIVLVITIIILLIFAMVTVNAVVGENGLIARAMESKIVTAIADIIFDVESNIVDIKTENLLNNQKLTSTEMMEKLEERNLLTRNSRDSELTTATTIVMKSVMNDPRLKDLELNYNGDIWYDNYKRGKISLSSQTDTVYSTNKKVKITIIDGNISEQYAAGGGSTVCIINALENRDDFACWANKYGGIIATVPETGLTVRLPTLREEEYIAVYDKELKKKIRQNNMVMGINSEIFKYNNEYLLEFFATFNQKGYIYYDSNSKPSTATMQFGAYPVGLFIAVSDNYEDLILGENGHISNRSIAKQYELGGEYKEVAVSNYFSGDASSFKFSRRLVTDKDGEGKSAYFPVIENEEDIKYLNMMVIPKFCDASPCINELKERNKDVKKMYYRTGLIFYPIKPYGVGLTDEFKWYAEVSTNGKSYVYYDPTIKYIDI